MLKTIIIPQENKTINNSNINKFTYIKTNTTTQNTHSHNNGIRKYNTIEKWVSVFCNVIVWLGHVLFLFESLKLKLTQT